MRYSVLPGSRRSLVMVGIVISMSATVLVQTSVAQNERDTISVVELRCEYSERPLAVDIDKPHFSWALSSKHRDQRQSAYQILVASSPELLQSNQGNKWDSGRVESDRSVNVPYGGAKLQSKEACYWKVRVWDSKGNPSDWSKIATFEMGLFLPEDWQGEWIGLADHGGLTFTEGRIGKAADLSGRIQSLRINHYGALKPEGQITVSAWIKPRQVTGDDWQAIYHTGDRQSRHVLAIGSHKGEFGLWAGFGIEGRYVEAVAPLNVNEFTNDKWHHVAVSYDDRQIVLYVDGQRQNVRSVEGVLNNDERAPVHILCGLRAPAYIGSNCGASEAFEGAIDDLRVFSTTLSGELIQKLATGQSIEEQPVGWWKFDGDLSNSASGNNAVAVYNNDLLPSPLLRKEFKLDKQVKRARVYICGLGYSELYLNGQKVSDHVLDPACTDYNKHIPYVTHDVTKLLKQGDNAIGVMLGNSWYCEPCDQRYGNSPRLLLQFDIELADGSKTNIVSDRTWKTIAGPVLKNSLWRSEEYDARREQPGWMSPNFQDQKWEQAVVKTKPGGLLVSQMMPAIKVTQTIKPVKFTSPKPGVYVYDLGQHFGGWVRVKFKGAAGTRVAIRYSERFDDRIGEVNQRIHVSGTETDHYTLKGDPAGEFYEPHFDFHPVRYVQVEGYRGELTADDLVGCVVHSAVDLSSDFDCSNKLLNQIHKNIRWTLTNGLFGFPLDCLHREMIGPIDPATIAGNLYPRPYMPLFWLKWLADIRDAQHEDGSLPDIAPEYWIYGGLGADPMWAGNYPLLVWYLYAYYDDRRILEDNYEPVKKWVDYCTAHAVNNYYVKGKYPGEHLVPGADPGGEQFMSKETPTEFLWTGYYYRAASIAAKMAEVLGKQEEAKTYATLAEEIVKAINDKWFQPETNSYSTGSPTALFFPLALGIVPDGRAQQVADNANRVLLEKYGGHVHGGNTGTTCMIDTLAAYGHGETMYGVATKTTYPGWGYMVVNGATTIWENWGRELSREQHGGQESMIMWGTLDEFLFNDLVGIKGPDYHGSGAFAPGFKQIKIKPYVLGDLTHVAGSMPTVHGKISVRWQRDGEKLTLKTTIPGNCRGTVSVPKIGLSEFCIEESGKSVWQNGKYMPGDDGVHSGRDEAEHVTFDVGSGEYEFVLSPTE